MGLWETPFVSHGGGVYLNIFAFFSDFISLWQMPKDFLWSRKILYFMVFSILCSFPSPCVVGPRLVPLRFGMELGSARDGGDAGHRIKPRIKLFWGWWRTAAAGIFQQMPWSIPRGEQAPPDCFSDGIFPGW